jgi:predicted nucleic acid-binding protein
VRLVLDCSDAIKWFYIALALREDLRVLTADERMTKAFGKLLRTTTLREMAP